MANFNLTIELSKFFGANRVTTKSGQEVVVIPLDGNPITIGKKGNVYLSLEAREKKQIDPWGGTHFIKPKYKKDDFVKLTDEQRDNIPFVGTCYMPQNNYGGNANTHNPQNVYTPSANPTDIDDSMF